MSLVTNFILSASYLSRDSIHGILSADLGRGQTFARIDGDTAGGYKVLESDLFSAGVNYADDTEDILKRLLASIDYADGCVLIIHHEHDDEVPPRVWVLRETGIDRSWDRTYAWRQVSGVGATQQIAPTS